MGRVRGGRGAGEGERSVDKDAGTLAALERERDRLQQQIYTFVEGLHATWERPDDPALWTEDFEARLSEWVASQANDLGALRDRIHHLRALLVALDDKEKAAEPQSPA